MISYKSELWKIRRSNSIITEMYICKKSKDYSQWPSLCQVVSITKFLPNKITEIVPRSSFQWDLIHTLLEINSTSFKST